MNIIYSSDEGYFQHAVASITSLLENNKNNDIKIFYIENKLKKDSIQKLKEIIKQYKQKIEFISIDKICKGKAVNDNFPIAAFARLFIANYIDSERALYLDCDTIVMSDITELYNTNFDDCLVAGVQDNVEEIMKNIIGMHSDDRYINSGVLLINLKKWKNENIDEKIIAFLKKYNGKVPHHDQGIINGVCKDRIKILPPQYNFMSQFFIHSSTQMKRLSHSLNFYNDEELTYAKKNIVIIHYIEKFYGRPWSNYCTHPMKNQYDNYLQLSNISYKKSNIKLALPIRMRKFVYYHFPFIIYLIVENVLEIKRNIHIRKEYTVEKDINN